MKGYFGSMVAILATTMNAAVAEELFLPDAGLDTELSGFTVVPEVLTATRLKQPRSEEKKRKR